MMAMGLREPGGRSAVPFYLVILVIASLVIALFGRKRDARLASWVMFAIVAVACLGFLVHLMMQNAETNRVAADRLQQVSRNSKLPLGGSAVLTGLSLPGLGDDGQLLLSVTAVDYSAHPAPTNIRGGADARFLDPKHRVWTDPGTSQKLVTVSVTAENRSQKAVSIPFGAVELQYPAFLKSEGFPAAWLRPAGQATAVRVGEYQVQPGSKTSFALYFFPSDEVTTYIDSLALWKSPTDVSRDVSPVAQWNWPQRHLSWHYVGTFTGEGGPLATGSGPLYKAQPQRRYLHDTQAFRLAGGMVKVDFRVSKPKWNPPGGPYLEMGFSNVATGEYGIQGGMIPDTPDVQTDYYHRESLQLEEKSAGKYRLEVLSCNAGWSFDVYEQRWE